MSWILLLIVFSAIFAAYRLASHWFQVTAPAQVSVQQVKAHAGTMAVARASADSFVPVEESSMMKPVLKVGQYVYDPRDYIAVEVDSTCMRKRGLNDDDTVYAERLYWWNNKKKLKVGDILLIKVPKEDYPGGYKLRELDHFKKNQAYTLSYEEDGSKRPSTNTHNIKDIVGVVRFKQIQQNK